MSLDDLLSRFSNLDCNAASHQPHVLRLEFPVSSILPHGSHPYLEPPSDVAHRCPPPDDRRVSGLLDIDFPVILTANTTTLPADPAPHSMLLNAIAELPRLRGSSVLGVVSYFDESTNQVMYGYRLKTSTANGFSSSRHFKLDSNESCMLFSLASALEWVSLLQHLIARESEQAYYHVRKRLTDAYGFQAALEEEQGWDVSWGESQQFSLNDAFRSRVTSMFPLSAAGERNALCLKLPCGHIIETTTTQIVQMTEEECRNAKCTQCQALVLQDGDVHEVEVAIESIKCAKQHRQNAHWVALDHVPSGHSRQFNGKALAAATRAALNSFAVSPLVSPPALCFAGSQYTHSIIGHFESFFSGEEIQVVRKPDTLVELLVPDALETAVNEHGEALSNTFVPPAFVRYLYVWLCRAVNFLCDRECDEMRTSHLGIHRHGRKLMYNPALWAFGSEGEEPLIDGEEEMQDSGDEMNVLNADMREMDLEGTSGLYAVLGSMDITIDQSGEALEEEL